MTDKIELKPFSLFRKKNESDKALRRRLKSEYRKKTNDIKSENKRLKKELDDLKKEDLLRADIKKVIDYALKEGIIDFPSLELKED